MIILHIMPDLNPGGAELMMKRLIDAHRGNPGFEHHVISLRELRPLGESLRAQGISVETLGLHSLSQLPGTIFRLVSRIRALRPDIVQTWMYHADLFGGVAARVAGCRRIIWGVRIADIGTAVGVSRSTEWIRRACASLSSSIPSKILYVAESARRVHERIGYDPAKSIIIENGYNIPPPTPEGRGLAPIRSELGLDDSLLLVGSAGRFSAQKDFRTFIEACSKVAEHLPRARFVIAGREIEWANAELAGWIEKSGHRDRFHLVGHRDNFSEFLGGLDIFCLHSLQEGFPNVVAEAMAMGIPCVVTDVGDSAALVEDTGLAVQPADPQGLAEALRVMLDLSGEERARLGARARRRIEDHFSMDAVRARYESLYRELVGPGDGHSGDNVPGDAAAASATEQDM